MIGSGNLEYMDGAFLPVELSMNFGFFFFFYREGMMRDGILFQILKSLQENSGILMDIPTENEILGISRRISEETENLCFLGISSEYTDVFLGKNR